MTERRDAAPDGGTTPPEDVPPTPEEFAVEADEDILEADIEEDITAPHSTGPTEPGGGADVASGASAAGAAGAETGRRRMRPDERRASRQATAPASARPADRVHIGDRASRLFVLASIATFSLILLYGLLLGQGGVLSPDRSPTPAVSASAGAPTSPSASASAGASPSVSPGASGSPADSPSAGTGPSPSPTAGGSPSPS